MSNPMSENRTKAMEILNRMFTAEMQSVQSGGTDMSGIAAAFHQDIVVHEPVSLPFAGDWRGHEGLKQLFKNMHEKWSSMDVEDMQATIDGDTLFMSCTFVATARQTNTNVRLPFAEILKMKDGLVSEAFPFYYDTVAINRALDFSPVNPKV